MPRLVKLLCASPALLALALASPAVAAETGAETKDRAHQEKLEHRMKARAAKPHRTFKDRVDQAADGVRVGGSWTARKWHRSSHATKKGVHKAAKRTAKATQ
jgi:hypothetical protein